MLINKLKSNINLNQKNNEENSINSYGAGLLYEQHSGTGDGYTL